MFWSDLGSAVGFEAIGLIDSSLPTVAIFAKQNSLDEIEKHLALDEVEKNDEKEKKEETSTEAVNVSKANNNSSKNNNIDTPKINQSNTPECKPNCVDKYDKGIIFYMQRDRIVGILLWNVFNRISIARKILASDDTFNDLNEVAKLFDIFDQHNEDSNSKNAKGD